MGEGPSCLGELALGHGTRTRNRDTARHPNVTPGCAKPTHTWDTKLLDVWWDAQHHRPSHWGHSCHHSGASRDRYPTPRYPGPRLGTLSPSPSPTSHVPIAGIAPGQRSSQAGRAPRDPGGQLPNLPGTRPPPPPAWDYHKLRHNYSMEIYSTKLWR